MSSIKSLDAGIIADSRGDKTIEVSLHLDDGRLVLASVPQGKSRGSFEAVYTESETAVNNIKDIISPALAGLDVYDQAGIDNKMIELDGTFGKSKLGANALLAFSIASDKAAALDADVPLWRHLRKLYGKTDQPQHSPRLFANIINGGLHADNGLPCQEYMVIPKSVNAQESFESVRNIYNAVKNIMVTDGREYKIGDEGGFAPVFENSYEPFEVLRKASANAGLEGKIDFGLDAAASNVKMNAEELYNIYEKMKNDHGLWYLEDPFSEDDFENFSSLRKKMGGDVIVAGDDLTVTNLKRMEKAKESDSINGIIIKPNQIGTVSETLDAIRQAKDWNWTIVISHRSGETMDDFIADLAFAVEADGLKAGAPSQKERLAKYERLIRIENS